MFHNALHYSVVYAKMGHAMAQLVEALRTGRRIAVLIPNYVNGISH